MSIFEREAKKKEMPAPEAPESSPVFGESNLNEDPNLVLDAEAQVEVDERAAAKLLDEIKSGVIEKGESVAEDEKRKLLQVSHNKWIEGTKNFAKDVGQIAISSVTVYLILRQLGIEIPLPIIAAISSASMVSIEKKKDKK
jgi:hypothetical protein